MSIMIKIINFSLFENVHHLSDSEHKGAPDSLNPLLTKGLQEWHMI